MTALHGSRLRGQFSPVDDPQVRASLVVLERGLTALRAQVDSLASSEEAAAEPGLALALSDSVRRLDTQVLPILQAIERGNRLTTSGRRGYVVARGGPRAGTGGPESAESATLDELSVAGPGTDSRRSIEGEPGDREEVPSPVADRRGELRNTDRVGSLGRAQRAELRDVAACIRRASEASQALIVLSGRASQAGVADQARLCAADLLDVADALSAALDRVDAITEWLVLATEPPARSAAVHTDVISRRLARLLLDDEGAELQAGAKTEQHRPDGLTAREAEVLGLLAGGRTSKEIAAELVVEVPTVSRHIANIYGKIGARGRADATRYAIAHGLARASSPNVLGADE